MSLLSSDFSMKNTLMWLFLVLGSLHTVWAQQAAVSDNAFNTVGYRSLPPLPAGGGKGVSAAFAGVAHNRLYVGGGCNFPSTPAAEGGSKAYYRDIYMLPLHAKGGAKWTLVGQMPEALAYGVALDVPEGMVWLGGCHAQGSSAAAWLLKPEANGRLTRQALPPPAQRHL